MITLCSVVGSFIAHSCDGWKGWWCTYSFFICCLFQLTHIHHITPLILARDLLTSICLITISDLLNQGSQLSYGLLEFTLIFNDPAKYKTKRKSKCAFIQYSVQNVLRITLNSIRLPKKCLSNSSVYFFVFVMLPNFVVYDQIW